MHEVGQDWCDDAEISTLLSHGSSLCATWHKRANFVTISILRNTNAGSSLSIGMEYHHQKNDIFNFYQFPTRISVEKTKKRARKMGARCSKGEQ